MKKNNKRKIEMEHLKEAEPEHVWNVFRSLSSTGLKIGRQTGHDSFFFLGDKTLTFKSPLAN